VIDRLLPGGRQLRTNAHALVEMTLMEQPARRRTLIHMVNGTGHQDTAYFPPIEIRDIRIELPSPGHEHVRRARAVALGRTLPIEGAGPRRWFTLPRLQAYEVLVIE
jgi:hypothetical protein